MPIFVGAGTSSFMKDGEGIGFPNLTTSQRDNLSGANRVTGQVIFNTDRDFLEIWTGSVWIELFSNPNSSSGGTKDTTSRSGYTVHTFTSPGTLQIVGQFNAEYLVELEQRHLQLEITLSLLEVVVVVVRLEEAVEQVVLIMVVVDQVVRLIQ